MILRNPRWGLQKRLAVIPRERERDDNEIIVWK